MKKITLLALSAVVFLPCLKLQAQTCNQIFLSSKKSVIEVFQDRLNPQQIEKLADSETLISLLASDIQQRLDQLPSEYSSAPFLEITSLEKMYFLKNKRQSAAQLNKARQLAKQFNLSYDHRTLKQEALNQTKELEELLQDFSVAVQVSILRQRAYFEALVENMAKDRLDERQDDFLKSLQAFNAKHDKLYTEMRYGHYLSLQVLFNFRNFLIKSTKPKVFRAGNRVK